MLATPRVNFITGNAHKLREVKAMLEPEIEVQNENLDLEEVQGTIEEVSKSKCRRAADMVSLANGDPWLRECILTVFC